MGEANRTKRLDDAIEAARRCWGAAALLTGDDRTALLNAGARYALREACKGSGFPPIDAKEPARPGAARQGNDLDGLHSPAGGGLSGVAARI